MAKLLPNGMIFFFAGVFRIARIYDQQQRKNSNNLCVLCVSSEAGGETYSLTHSQSKDGTIPLGGKVYGTN
jgi:hypothetical protein